MVELGKARAVWEKTEEIEQPGGATAERTIRFAVRRDGSLVRSESNTYEKTAEEDKRTVETGWELISDSESTASLEEVGRRMTASDFTLVTGDVPEPTPEPAPQPAPPTEG